MQPEMTCAVCTQPARGFHFGAFTCEGCKSFFGRTTQRGSQNFTCRLEGKCDIRGSKRKACKACRYNACILAGMSSASGPNTSKSRWLWRRREFYLPCS